MSKRGRTGGTRSLANCRCSKLPTDRRRPPVQTYNGAAHTWPLDPASVQQLRVLIKEQGVTSFASLLAVFQVLLHRLSGQDDFCVATAVADRKRPEWERLIGYLLNQVVLRADFGADGSFRDFLERTQDRVLAALDHQDVPFGLIVKRLQPRRDASRSPIFQVMFVWDKPHTSGPSWADAGAAAGLPAETLIMEQRGAPFDLTMIVFETGDRLRASFRYNTDLFDQGTIERMAGYFDTLLAAMVHAPDRLLSEVDLLSAAERRRLLVDYNDTRCPYANESGFHQLFEAQARAAPHAAALHFEDQTWSYQELNARANQLARHLETLGVRRGSTVAISLPRGLDLIVTVLATWKAGAAYLYLDTALPAQRLAGMVADCRPPVLVAADDQADLGLPAVRLPRAWTAIRTLPEHDLNLPIGAGDRAYLIYTSGSTGKPKGTILLHGGLCNFAESVQRCFRIRRADRVLQFASLSFDASIFEMAMAMPAGAALVLGTQAMLLPGPGLLRLLRDQAVTATLLPPSVLALLSPPPLPALRIVIAGGESCSAEVVAAWSPGREFYNAFGPTETTVWATVAHCVADGRPPTIGRPVANTRVYVLDRHLQAVPLGVSGELYVAGPGLAEGYMNQPELTAERFLPNPFDEADGAVMYRTGDLVRWTADGELEFCGRRDQQVKLRGYRIELEEIQEVLRRHPDVVDAAVILRAESGKAAALVAYVVPRSSEKGVLPAIRAYLREHLPHYMLPQALVPLDALPQTVSGKLDRGRLPAPSCDTVGEDTIAPPRTPAERALAAIWAQVLNVRQVGIHDNFFDLGGASLQTLEVAAQARTQGHNLSPEMIFRHQTVAELAAACVPDGTTPSQEEVVSITVSARPTPGEATAAVVMQPEEQELGLGARIESIGVYLPARSLTTEEVLKKCRTPLDFPLARLTGIHSRRVAGDNEFSITLAEKALAECLARSAHAPESIDLIVCANISRCDGPGLQFTSEPTTAARLRRTFGLVNAIAFDVSNACTGTFTALVLVDSLIRLGTVRRALIVSGEYLTHLTRTAQLEIDRFMDPRLACLTVGDSGLALLVEQAPSAAVGFHEIDLYTLGKYHDYCVAKATREPHGGAIMHTDPVKATAVSVPQIVSHALEHLHRKRWGVESVDALIMHQTSETTIDGAIREINRACGRPVCHRGNVVYSIAERGNTATTTHFIALWERMLAGELHPGARLVFGVSGSGQTVGTALYTLDELAERVRTSPPTHSTAPAPLAAPLRAEALQFYRCEQPVRIESIGTDDAASETPADTVVMVRRAGKACLVQSAKPRAAIDLVIYTGVFRTEFLSEPAVAAIAAGNLAINHDESRTGKTLAFDLTNGAAGTLTACFLVSQLIAAGKFTRALVLASEVENNATVWPENLVGLKETASALVLEATAGGDGFTAFGFRFFSEFCDAISSYTVGHNGLPALEHRRDPGLDEQIVAAVQATVADFLDRAGVRLCELALVIPPQCATSA